MNFFTKAGIVVIVCASSSYANAQTVITQIGANITSTEQITADASFAFYNTGRSLYVYNGTSRYEMGKAPELNVEGNTAYVWTFEKQSNGKYKIKDNTNKYIPVLQSGATMTGSDNGDEFTITASNGKWLIQGTDGNYFNGNGENQGFVGWNEAGGNSLYEIRPVTLSDLSALSSYTLTMTDADGKVFDTQTVNGQSGTSFTLPTYAFRSTVSCTYNGQPMTITDNTITLPESTEHNIVITYADALPFKTTTISNGEFVGATWYQMGVHNNQNRTYLKYNSDDHNIINLIPTSSVNLSDDSQLWCFAGNLNDGFKIYNKAAGTSISISYSTAYNTNGSNHAIMADANAAAAIWKLVQSTATESELSEGFCFQTEEAQDANIYLNQRNTFMSYWYDRGNGSTFVVKEINDSELDESTLNAFNAALAEAQKYSIGNKVCQYQDVSGDFVAALEEASAGAPADISARIELTNRLTAATEALVLNQPEAGKYYRIKSKVTGKYITSNAAIGEKPDLVEDGTDQNTVFYLSADKRLTGYTCLNIAGNGTYSNNAGDSFNFTESEYTGHYVIRVSGNTSGAFYDYDKTGKLDTWSNVNDERCAWILEEVNEPAQQPKLNKQMTAEYATLAAPVALNIPTGVKAYTVTVDEAQETAILEEVNGVIPAGTAVILKKESDESSFDFTYAPEGSTENSNSLVGVYKATNVAADINAYILGNGSKGIGFYQMNAGDRTLGANKAYLALPATMNHVRSITIGGPTTGIEDAVAEGVEAEEYYDLQGRRVMNPVKGIYVTKSGKKVIFNK